MKAPKEGFDLLDIKGVDRKIQHLFSDIFREDDQGRLWANYRDGTGNIVDQEVLSISKLKLSSGGILSFSTVHPLSARSLYISDSVANLIFFVQSYSGRLSWEYAAFIATGAKLERDQFIDAVQKFPFVKRYYTIVGHSLIGRIRDCKVQHWLNGEDCYFRMEGDVVVADYYGEEFLIPADKFSLRNHLRQIGVRQTVRTRKPSIRNFGNFFF